MGVLGSLTSFVAGAAIGAAGGVASARLFAPRSGDRTQQSFEDWKSEIATAGQLARAKTESELERQYRATVAERDSKGGKP